MNILDKLPKSSPYFQSSGHGDWYRVYAATVNGSAQLLAAGLGGRSTQEALEEIDTWNIDSGAFTYFFSSFHPKNWGRCGFSKY